MQSLGIDTIERLQAALHVASFEMRAFLGIDVDAFLAGVPAAIEVIPADDLAIVESAEYPLGVEGRTRIFQGMFLYWDCKMSDGIPNKAGTCLVGAPKVSWSPRSSAIRFFRQKSARSERSTGLAEGGQKRCSMLSKMRGIHSVIAKTDLKRESGALFAIHERGLAGMNPRAG